MRTLSEELPAVRRSNFRSYPRNSTPVVSWIAKRILFSLPSMTTALKLSRESSASTELASFSSFRHGQRELTLRRNATAMPGETSRRTDIRFTKNRSTSYESQQKRNEISDTRSSQAALARVESGSRRIEKSVNGALFRSASTAGIGLPAN